MFSVRDSAKNDMKATLEKVSALGYTGVEFAGVFDNSASDVRKWLDEYKLDAFSAHIGFSILDNDFEGTVNYYKEIGTQYFVIPSAPYITKNDLDTSIDKINKYQEMLERHRIPLAYHNHNREYFPNENGQIPHNEIEKRTNVDFELDTFWTLCGGLDSISEMERLKDRIKIIHLKDGFVEKNISVAIGEGNAPIKLIINKAVNLGFKMIVESEGLNPDGLSEVERCIRYLHTLDSNKYHQYSIK